MIRIDENITVVREEERGYAAAAHLVGAIPLWGFVFLAAIWIYFKERSREVVFHVQQALVFQMLFLAVAVFTLALQILFEVVAVLQPGLAHILSHANIFFLMMVFTVYACVSVFGCALTWLGRPFLYPVIGRRVLEGTLTKNNEQRSPS